MDKIKIGILTLAAVVNAPCFSGAMGPITSNSWSGLYLGGQLGEAWGYQKLRQETPAGTHIGYARDNNSSFIGGGYVGLNWQINDFVIGIEGDGNGVDLSRYSACLYQSYGVDNPSPGTCFSPTYDFDIQMQWQAAVRGRIGWIWMETLFYVAGGVTFTEVKSTFTTAANYVPLGSETYRTNYTGSTAGVGIEYKFNGHWVARGEYRYNNLGSNRQLITQGGGFWNQYIMNNYIKDNTFLVGLSYLI
jgi:outer membrane immunogenic protein